MNTVGTIVARTGSSRVPGKALLDVAGSPVIAHITRIARQINGIDSLCLATTTLASDDQLANIAGDLGLQVFRGDAEKVLDRLHAAARFAGADTIVYIGGDCPLLDPDVVSRAVGEFATGTCDYLSNYDPPTFPGGLDVNVISFAALDTAFARATAPSQRVHAFSYITFHPEEFRIANFTNGVDLSTYHWAIDDPDDVDFVRLVYQRLYKGDGAIRMNNVLELLDRDEDVRASHERIRKPPVAHAFMASPHMMKDIHADIAFLCRAADAALQQGDYCAAERCHAEIFWIARKLGA